MKSVLILTCPEDLHAFAVREAILAKGGEVTLWHTPDFPSKTGESVLFEGGAQDIRVSGPELELVNPNFGTVWRRRPSYSIDWSKIHPSDRRFVDVECNIFRRALHGLISPEAFWVNRPEAALVTNYKMLQHSAAAAVGFETPDTLYSNDPTQIRAFIRRHAGEVVYKPLRGMPWQSEKSTWMSFTSRLTEEQLVEDDLLRSAPGIYQELVPKAFELRVTVLGRCAMAAELLSQDTKSGKLDWRRASDTIKVRPFTLPSEVTDRCFHLMAKLGLVFGCFDFIVTPKGKFIFLEVNEMGQFLFLERDSGLPLLDRFSEFLLSGRADFDGTAKGKEVRFADVLDIAKAASEHALAIHTRSPETYSNDDPSEP